MDIDGFTVGRIVHYVAYGTPKGEYEQGAHRAAIITEIPQSDNGACVLAVFNPTGIHWNTAAFDEAHTFSPGTWHWPER